MTIEADADIRRKEAADWFARLNQRKVSTNDVKAFSAWRADPANAVAFERLEAMWDAAKTLGQTQEIAAFAAEARERRNNGSPPPRQRLVGVLKPATAIGAVILALGAGVVVWRVQQPTVYSTTVGEQRAVQLADGSRVIIDTDSRVSVRFTKGRRTVTLESGQAMFAVQGDANRPFMVRAGQTEVVALGTRFDVRRLGDGARVVLVEGRVAVRDAAAPDRRWSLAPGQQVVTAARSPRVAAVDVPAATSWTRGRLTFEGTPIAVAVAEVNRYTRQPIELRDEKISSIRVSGAFDAGDIEGFVAALQDLYPLEAQRAPDGHLILSSPG